PNKLPKLPRCQRFSPRPSRQRQHHSGRLIHTPNKRIPSNNHPHRPARIRTHPAKRDSTSISPSNPRVISRHKRGHPLPPPRISTAPQLPPAVKMRVVPPRNLPDQVSVKPQKSILRAAKTS